MTAQGVWRFGAVLFTLLGAFSAIVFARLRWTASDVDVVGFVWFVQNLPKLAALGCIIVFFSIALWCFIRSVMSFR
ncbi:MAG TPA: hypothetical protein VL549_05705 [Gemmatimonadales bacterium]|nr:hypothetical protein [Gemmatimonadales bacterium]